MKENVKDCYGKVKHLDIEILRDHWGNVTKQHKNWTVSQTKVDYHRYNNMEQCDKQHGA